MIPITADGQMEEFLADFPALLDCFQGNAWKAVAWRYTTKPRFLKKESAIGIMDTGQDYRLVFAGGHPTYKMEQKK